jgi:hypothetical protein
MANERADGDLSTVEDRIEVDTGPTLDEASVVDSTGDKGAIGADEYDADRETAENEYVDDRAIVTAGGTQSRTDPLKKTSITTNKTYRAIIGRVEGDLKRSSVEDLGTLSAIAEAFTGLPINDAPISLIMSEIQRRINPATNSRSDIVDFQRELIAANEAYTKKTQKADYAAENSTVDDTDGQEVSYDDVPDTAGRSEPKPTPAVVVRKKRTIEKPAQFSKNTEVGQAPQATVTITGADGNQIVLENPGRALEVQGKKIDQLKALLKCLSGG